MRRNLILLALLWLALAWVLCIGALAEGAGYTVEFGYGGLEYVLPGGTSVPLTEALDALNLTGEAEAVAVSDASLFSASDATGEWVITAHRAFSTAEWMNVTIGGAVHEITVTDTQEPVSYIDANGEGQICDSFTLLTERDTTWSGWVVASGTVNIGYRVEVSGEAHLIFEDGAALNITGGIHVVEGNSLNIYGQSTGDGMGALTITGVASSFAGIGGNALGACGSVTINGGAGGTITINAGAVTASGAANVDVASIGDGRDTATGGEVIIRGGVVTANEGFIGGTNSTISLNLPDGASVKTSNKGFRGTVTVATGRSVSDGTARYTGTLTDAQKDAAAGKTLVNGPTAQAVTLPTGIENDTLTASHA